MLLSSRDMDQGFDNAMPKRSPRHQHIGYRTDADHDERRGSSRQRGYTARWERARNVFLAANPLCVMCEREGRFTPATIVDHIVAHRRDQTLFWDQDNWQGLCTRHHNREKQREERGREREDVTKLFPLSPRV